MRVLHVINGLGTGGAERSLQEMLPLFRTHGVHSEIAVFHERHEGVQRFVAASGTRVHHIDEPTRRRRVTGLRRLIAAVRPDLVHTTIIEADVIGRIAAIGTGIPVATSLVNTSWDPSRTSDPRLNLRKIEVARGIDAVTALALGAGFHAISPAVRDDAVATLRLRPDEIRVIPRGRSVERLGRASPERRDRARAQLGLGPLDRLVLNVGRQEYQKGQDVLIDAMARLVPTQPRVHLAIAGRSGNVSAQLAEQVARAGLADRVRFLGHTDDVPELLCAADVFAFPSRFEGLGGSLLEALALGVPIVASDVPAIRWVLDDGRAGWLVPSEDAGALAGGLQSALDDVAARDAHVAAGQRRFAEDFRLEAVSQAMVGWFREVAARA